MKTLLFDFFVGFMMAVVLFVFVMLLAALVSCAHVDRKDPYANCMATYSHYDHVAAFVVCN